MFSIGKKTLYDKLFWLFILLFSLLKIFICRSFPLTDDDIFFCNYLNSISSCYLEHPPIIAYVLKLFSIFFGNTNLMPRICLSVIYFIAAYVLYCFIKKTTKSLIVSQLSILLLYSTPVLNMLECSTDIPFLLFFILSFYLFYCFLKSKSNKYLYLLSIAITFGLLSKYTMLCIYPSFLIFLLISKENRYILKSVKFYIFLFLPLIIFSIMILISNFSIKDSLLLLGEDLFYNRLRSSVNIKTIDVVFQFIGSQLIFYNSVLTYIYKDILISIVYEYIPFIKYYAFFTITVLILLYIHMFYLYKKTKQFFPLFIFCFSIFILVFSVMWSFITFPIEYCAKVSVMLIYIYIVYLISRYMILKLLLICFIIFGLYISLINPIYSIYNYDSLSPNSIVKKLKKKYDFKKDAIFEFLNPYLEYITKDSVFVVHMDLDYTKFYLYYLSKQQYCFKVLFLFDDNFYFWNQNIKDLNGKDCFIFLNSKNVEWFDINRNIIDNIYKEEIFDYIEKLNEETFFCKNFNYKKYREYYSLYHYELQD